MNNSKKPFNFILTILGLLPLFIPILNIYLGLLLTISLFPSQTVYFNTSSIFGLSFKIFLFALVVDLVLSLIGFNPDKRLDMMVHKKFTSFIFEGSTSIFALTVGYSSIRSLGLTGLTLFRGGLVFFILVSTLLDLLTLFFMSFFMNKDKEKKDN